MREHVMVLCEINNQEAGCRNPLPKSASEIRCRDPLPKSAAEIRCRNPLPKSAAEIRCRNPLPIRCRQRFTTQNDIEIPLSARSPSRIQVTDIHIYFGVERTLSGAETGFFAADRGIATGRTMAIHRRRRINLAAARDSEPGRGLLKSRAFLMRAMPAC